MQDHIINTIQSELLSKKTKESRINELYKKKMDNLHFIPNNIVTKFFKKLTKYKNDYQQYLLGSKTLGTNVLKLQFVLCLQTMIKLQSLGLDLLKVCLFVKLESSDCRTYWTKSARLD